MQKEDVEDLALLLLHEFSWDENSKKKYGEKPILRSWKNIRFEILDALNERGLISDSKKSKSVLLTEDGIKRATEIRKKYFDQ